MFKKALFTFAVVFTVTGHAVAQDNDGPSHEWGLYISGEKGTSHFYSASDINYQGDRYHNVSSHTSGWGVHLGYTFGPYFGVEIGRVKLGSPVSYTTDSDGNTSSNLDIAWKSDEISLVGNWYVLSKLFVITKVGRANVSMGDALLTGSTQNTHAIRGELGVGFDLTRTIQITASYAHYFINSGSIYSHLHTDMWGSDSHMTKTMSAPVGFASFGVRYQF